MNSKIISNYRFVIIILFSIGITPIQSKPHHLAGRSGGRIIGGQVAFAGQFPFIAAIYVTTSDGTYFCSGTLLNSDYILTAGQSVVGAITFSIRLGSTSLTKNEESVVRVSTDIYYLHPEYNAVTLENDVGLIKLRMPISYSMYVSPINFLIDQGLPDGSPVTTVGWGQISDEEAGLVDELMYVQVATLGNEECRLTYGSQITDNMLCVEGNYNEGTCNGDLGSPLFQYGPREYKYLVGISSFLSGNGCESTDPSGFTRSAVYREWIRSIVNN